MVEKGIMQFTGERVVEGSTPKRIWLDHISRYEFAIRYVKEKNVLDISCGTGYGSRYLYDAGAARVIGVDTSSETIDFARTEYQINELKFKIGDIQHIDFPENYFDVITCFETIEHIQNQARAFMEIRRVLKAEGLLIISSPNRKLTSPGKLIDDRPDNPFHTKEYSTEEFISVLENYFEILEVYGQRPISKLFFLPLFERIVRRFLPMIYDPGKGNPELGKVLSKKEYRYVTAICKKSKNDNL